MTTDPQDPLDRFALGIEEMRSMPVPRGFARLLHNLIADIFTCLLRLFAALAERRRNGTLPDLAPAAAPDQPRAWPPDLRPRDSGWQEHRSPEAAAAGGTMHAQVEQPQTPPEITEPTAEPPCQAPVVEQPTALPPPQRAHVRKLKDPSGPALAPPRHADDGRWPQWREPGLLWTTNAGFLRLDSQKPVLAAVDTCVHFVTI